LKSDVINIATLLGAAGNATDAAAMQLQYEDWMEERKAQGFLGIFIAKLVRYNVLPMLLFLCGMICSMVVWKTFGKIVVPIVKRIVMTILRVLLCGHCGTGADTEGPEKSNGSEIVPPYSGAFAMKLKIRNGHFEEISDKDRGKGWFVDEDLSNPDGPVAVKRMRYLANAPASASKMKKKRSAGIDGFIDPRTKVQGLYREVGATKLTWEAMDTYPASYRIRANKKYALALRELDAQLDMSGQARSPSVVQRLYASQQSQRSLIAAAAGAGAGAGAGTGTTAGADSGQSDGFAELVDPVAAQTVAAPPVAAQAVAAPAPAVAAPAVEVSPAAVTGDVVSETV